MNTLETINKAGISRTLWAIAIGFIGFGVVIIIGIAGVLANQEIKQREERCTELTIATCEDSAVDEYLVSRGSYGTRVTESRDVYYKFVYTVGEDSYALWYMDYRPNSSELVYPTCQILYNPNNPEECFFRLIDEDTWYYVSTENRYQGARIINSIAVKERGLYYHYDTQVVPTRNAK